MTIKALAYIRVSSLAQAKKGSLSTQRNHCLILAKKKGIKDSEVKIFKDSESAETTDRKNFKKLIEYAQSNASVEYLFISKIDRLTREGIAVYQEIKSSLDTLGITLLDYEGNISEKRFNIIDDLNIPYLDGYDNGQYTWAVINPNEETELAAANRGRKEGIEKNKRTQPESVTALFAGFSVGEPKYGYRNENYHTIDSNGENVVRRVQKEYKLESRYIRKMYELLLEGFTPESVCEKINVLGYRSRIRNRVGGTFGGTKLTTEQLKSYISRATYAGLSYEKRTNGYAIPARHEGFVSIDEWNKVNRMIGGKVAQLIPTNDPLRPGYKYIKSSTIRRDYKKFDLDLPFKGLIKSPYEEGVFLTGSFSTSASKERNNGYYHTTKKALRNYRASSKDVHKWFVEILSEIKFSDDAIEKLRNDIREEFSESNNLYLKKEEQINHCIKELEKRRSSTIKKAIACSSDTMTKIYEEEILKIDKELESSELLKGKSRMGRREFESILMKALKTIEHLPNLMSYVNSRELMRYFMRIIFVSPPSPEDLKNRTYLKTPLMRVKELVNSDENLSGTPAKNRT